MTAKRNRNQVQSRMKWTLLASLDASDRGEAVIRIGVVGRFSQTNFCMSDFNKIE